MLCYFKYGTSLLNIFLFLVHIILNPCNKQLEFNTKGSVKFESYSDPD